MAHERNDKDAAVIAEMAKHGVDLRKIALAVGVPLEEMKKLYEKEIETAEIENVKEVSLALFKNATKNNNTLAQIFWLKSRAGWVDAPQKVELTGQDGGPLRIQIEVKQPRKKEDGGTDD